MTARAQISLSLLYLSLFFFNDTATTEIYTLSLHDALPISEEHTSELQSHDNLVCRLLTCALPIRSEEHTSELQSHDNLVCRLLFENKFTSICRTQYSRTPFSEKVTGSDKIKACL